VEGTQMQKASDAVTLEAFIYKAFALCIWLRGGICPLSTVQNKLRERDKFPDDHSNAVDTI